MSDEDIERTSRIDRRKFVGGVGAGVAAGLAGCGAQDEDPGGTPTDTEGGGGGEDTDTPTEDEGSNMVEGGTPVVGLDTAPNTLNILQTSTAYSFEILDHVYTTGTVLNPETQEFTGWGFRDWEVNEANVGTDSPTITADLREDMFWHDGEPLTAEDVAFTVDYIQEQEPAGTVAASQFSAVENAEAADDFTVNYYLDEKYAGWFFDIVGNFILPQHIWSNVSDYQNYSPRNSEEGLVGSGPLVLEDWNWENWFQMSVREDTDALWQNEADYIGWLDDEGPFIDAWRLEVFGSQAAMQNALLNNEIDVAYGSFTVSNAVRAQNTDGIEVRESSDDGWDHHSYNTQRVPMDDKAFRQFLVLTLDSQWVVEDLKQSIGAVKGTYATPPAWQEWRPPEPTEIDEFSSDREGGPTVPVPDLVFPGERGTFQLGESGRQAARDFLVNHDEATYDFTFEEADAPEVSPPDGMVLHVDGEPLHVAHTDNDGNPEQGPLEMSFNPPQEDLDESRIAQRWVGALKRIGVPTEPAVQSFNSQIPKVYQNFNFDMFAMGWTGFAAVDDYYGNLYGSEGFVENGFAPMGYTGADDLIEEQGAIMEAEPRKPIVKEILATIWNDAPTNIILHQNVLQPVSQQWEGWVQPIGGVLNPSTPLNLRQVEM